MNKLFGICSALAVALSAAGVPAQAGGVDVMGSASATTSQIIVRLRDYAGSERELGISVEQLAALRDAAGVRLSRLRVMSGDARVLSLPGGLDIEQVEAIAARIAALPGVETAEPDRLLQPQLFTAVAPIPNDPLFADQWHYFEATGGINLPAAWEVTTGDPSVVAAIIDTGILASHEDLDGRWAGGYDFISMRFNARDGDGRDADPSDMGDWSRQYDSSWHGSHVAGTMGAASDNGVGVSGIDWQAQLLPVRVLGRMGGFTSDIVDAMRWSAGISVPGVPDNTAPAQVINMSLGGLSPCTATWQGAVDDVVAAGSVLVVAAGNSSADASGFVPAGCDGVVTVAANDRTGDLAWYSNFGSKVEISAPGGDTSIATNGVLSTLNTGARRPRADSYEYYQGTSMASPHVAGVVSLMFAVNPDLTPSEVLSILQDTARPFPAGTDCAADSNLCGAGILDAAAAVTAAQAALAP